MARGALAAVVLEPVPAQAVTITWTGVLLAAAAEAGLTTLQDIICVLDSPPDTDPNCGSESAVTVHQRVILLLRAQAGRHAH